MMLSMSPGMSARQAGGYFSKEDYYLRDAELRSNSRWCGEGSRALGLDGPEGKEEFRQCRGKAPGGSRIIAYRLSRDHQTGAMVKEHRAGNDDCTLPHPSRCP